MENMKKLTVNAMLDNVYENLNDITTALTHRVMGDIKAGRTDKGNYTVNSNDANYLPLLLNDTLILQIDRGKSHGGGMLVYKISPSLLNLYQIIISASYNIKVYPKHHELSVDLDDLLAILSSYVQVFLEYVSSKGLFDLIRS